MAVADSFDDRESSPAHDDDDDGAAVAVDATAVASGATAAAAAVVAAAADTDMDTCLDIGIGTAATGIGIDIGDWAGVFGAAALPGPAVPYRWDDMYHQKPGLAVCLHVVFNHFVYRHSFVSSLTLRPEQLSLSSSSCLLLLRLDPPCIYISLSFSLSEYSTFSRTDLPSLRESSMLDGN